LLHKAIVAGLTVDPETNAPILVLETDRDSRVVPIWIGMLEATAITAVLNKVQFDRPMTHDLFRLFVDQMGYNVVKVEITDIRENTYYARIHFVSREHTFSMDARPSDAIALGLRFNAPIYLDDRVIEKSAVMIDTRSEMADTSDEGKKWADYLEKLSPDDFGKYKV
jgi:bifunctional DNase/RNase